MARIDIEWWFATISSFNEAERRAIKSRSSSWDQGVGKYLFYGLFLFPFILSVLIAIIALLGEWRVLLVISVLILAFSYLGLVIYPCVGIWIHRNTVWNGITNPFSLVLSNSKLTAAVDREFLETFSSQSPEAVRFIIMELRAEKDSLERRLALIVGSLEKVGIIPGVLALAVVLSKLGEGQPDWVYVVAYAVPVFYAFGVISHFLLMRLDRVIQLLELVLKNHSQELTMLEQI